MASTMGVFFLLLAALKLFDLEGFVASFVQYDVLAQRDRRYAYAYPLIEITLGMLSLSGHAVGPVNLLILVVMGVGAYGVFKALQAGKKLECACLGSTLKLKLSTVSLVENLGMGLMALVMLIS